MIKDSSKDSPGDLGRAYLQGGSQEFGGEGRRGSRTVSEQIFFEIPSGIPSPKVSDPRIRKSMKNHPDSFGQTQENEI